mmetsp:Transcript_142574/g.355374  ORF Transcript_142574/g.355374 Transcript_142574/m.355374 type:complete len:203 (+) Transcript_142574:345-953(+)
MVVNPRSLESSFSILFVATCTNLVAVGWNEDGTSLLSAFLATLLWAALGFFAAALTGNFRGCACRASPISGWYCLKALLIAWSCSAACTSDFAMRSMSSSAPRKSSFISFPFLGSSLFTKSMTLPAVCFIASRKPTSASASRTSIWARLRHAIAEVPEEVLAKVPEESDVAPTLAWLLDRACAWSVMPAAARFLALSAIKAC